jgi:vacuolar protein sorting-associated protein 51
MSTIASPRPSVSLSSRRDSGSTDNTTRSASTSRPPAGAAGSLRRNRAALRDYYGLKNAAPADARDTPPTPTPEPEKESELDKPGFNAESYVRSLLAQEGLEGVLRVEASVVSEIRSLDGEKKALVYDNYSKLIAATDTIRSMREKMDPLTQTSTLTGDIEHIAETAAVLSHDLRERHGRDMKGEGLGAKKKREQQQQTVRWVLGAPERLRRLVADGRQEEAEKEWKTVSELLSKWESVKGVAEVRQACLQALDIAEG